MFMGIRLGVPALLGGGFSPATLFATAGSLGFFYDFSDYTTQFTDVAGTSGVTGVGQSLALVLDESQGLTPGPELVTNGDFSSGTTTGWTPISATLSVVSGALRITATTSGVQAKAYTSITTVAGKSYKITVNFVADAATGNSFVAVGAAAGGSELLLANIGSTLGTYSYVFTASGASAFVTLASSSTVIAAQTLDWDNVSVREIPGNHATQATAGNRPLTQVRPMFTQRNRAVGSELPENATYWPASVSQNGVTATKLAQGIDTDGLPYADYSVIGTATAISILTPYLSAFSRTPAAVGQTWNNSFIVRRLSGTVPPALCGVRFYIQEETAPLTFNGSTSGPIVEPPLTDTIVTGNYTLAFAATNQVLGQIDIRTASGATVNYNIRIKGFQFELGSARTTYQPAVSGELRNRAIGSGAVDNATYWLPSITSNGVTATKLASGTDTDGLPYADYSIIGTASATSFCDVYALGPSRTPASTGQTFTVSTLAQITSGTVPPAGCGAVVAIYEETAPSTGLTASASGQFASTTQGIVTLTYTLVNAAANQTRGAVYIRTASGATVNYNIRIKAFQFEQNATYSRYQRVVTANEWYEPGFTSYRGIAFDGTDDFLQTQAINFAGAESLGPELVTNGDFSVGTGWTLGTGWTIGSGVASFSAGVDNSDLAQSIGLPVIGTTYSITLSLTYTSGGSVRIIYGGRFYDVPAATGTYTVLLKATSAPEGNLRLRALTGASVFSIDNVSVKEVLFAADKMTVVAGVRKLSDASTGIVTELTVNTNTQNGSFFITAPHNSGASNFGFSSRGTILPATAAASGFPAPFTAVQTGIGDISADLETLRVNGSQVAQITSDQGTGNFANAAVYIGRRAGASLPFNGILTFLCVINRTLTAAELAQLEAFANSRTGAF